MQPWPFFVCFNVSSVCFVSLLCIQLHNLDMYTSIDNRFYGKQKNKEKRKEKRRRGSEEATVSDHMSDRQRAGGGGGVVRGWWEGGERERERGRTATDRQKESLGGRRHGRAKSGCVGWKGVGRGEGTCSAILSDLFGAHKQSVSTGLVVHDNGVGGLACMHSFLNHPSLTL